MALVKPDYPEYNSETFDKLKDLVDIFFANDKELEANSGGQNFVSRIVPDIAGRNAAYDGLLADGVDPTVTPVMILVSGQDVIYVNRGSGWNGISLTPNTIVVDDVVYPRSGRFSVSVHITTATGALFAGGLTYTMPFTPPSGWVWSIVAFSSAPDRYTWLARQDNSGGQNVILELLTTTSTGGVTPRVIYFAWQLVRNS